MLLRERDVGQNLSPQIRQMRADKDVQTCSVSMLCTFLFSELAQFE